MTCENSVFCYNRRMPALHLPDLIPPGVFRGAGVILRHQARFLFGMRPPRMEHGRRILEITGIGGKYEPTDADLLDCLRREVREEIKCQVRLRACEETLVVRGPGQFERLRLAGVEQPAAVVFRNHHTPPRQPWSNPHKRSGCAVMFLADLDEEPILTDELPSLIWLDPGSILDAARRDLTLAELLSRRSGLVTFLSLQPTDIWCRLTDSQEALCLALGDEAREFYNGLLNVR